MSGIIDTVGSKSGVIGTTELDYETGTWTPACTDSTSTECVYDGTRAGAYSKIGNIVTFTCYFRLNGFGSTTSAQAVRVRGLPYTSSGAADIIWASSLTVLQYVNFNTSAIVNAYVNQGDTYCFIYQSVQNTDGATMSLDTLSSDAIVRITGTYMTNET